ncbi:MAG: lysine-2,3-aminomutase-like protein [Alphaproteobacteria bacterium]|nr:lysine-2,3-aminomutase-like protein [Alphaproteobacteria bacterium]
MSWQTGYSGAGDQGSRDANSDITRVTDKYSYATTPEMRKLIAAELLNNSENRPISRQFLPDLAELATHESERDDPIGDDAHSPLPGLIHRYPDRVLVKLLEQCAVYCRFCFRREEVGGSHPPISDAQFSAMCDYIAARPALHEVILSGGDPLILSPRRLAVIQQKIAAIPHIDILRLHSRVPVVAPERITAEVLTALRPKNSKLAVYIMIHANHASEFSDAAGDALARLVDHGIILLGQSVLLRGVNNDVNALSDLFRTMLRHRITPHYLHHPDLARGTAHFRLSITEGQALMQQLRGRISGLAVPHYMLDIPGGFGKVPLTPNYALYSGQDWKITDPKGQKHHYVDDVLL